MYYSKETQTFFNEFKKQVLSADDWKAKPRGNISKLHIFFIEFVTGF